MMSEEVADRAWTGSDTHKVGKSRHRRPSTPFGLDREVVYLVVTQVEPSLAPLVDGNLVGLSSGGERPQGVVGSS